MAGRTAVQSCVKARVLLVDEDAIVRENISALLSGEGYEVVAVAGEQEAAEHLAGSHFALLISDVSTGAEGFDLLQRVRDRCGGTSVILTTRYGSIGSAVKAIRLGACDYLTKPFADEDICRAVERAMDQSLASADIGDDLNGFGRADIIGQDYRMAKVFELIEAVAQSQTTVLITGESGTGKSLVARAVHARSSRRDHPFVEVACGALTDSLLESELFGHVRGAFTNAVADKPGKFAAAEGGTIFLDEIATATPHLQVKLLRVLQERRFEPVGSNETQRADARVILATNCDLWADVEAGRFRKDLYYRINVVNIELPPLRQRTADIPLLAGAFLRRFLAVSSKQILDFSPEAVDMLQQYSWPGNVRELENCVERAVVLCRQPYIGLTDLPPAVLNDRAASPKSISAGEGETLKEALAEPERELILRALDANGHNRQVTATQLGINRTTLYKKMKRYGLS